MSSYNGFEVYKRDENGKLVPVQIENDTNWISAKNDYADIWEPAATSWNYGDFNKQIIFNKDFNGINSADVIKDYDPMFSGVKYIYKDYGEFKNAVQANIEEATDQLEKELRVIMQEKIDLESNREKWVNTLKGMDNEIVIDKIIAKIEDIDHQIAAKKDMIRQWYFIGDNQYNDYPIINAYKEMLNIMDKYANDPDYVVAVYYSW